MDKASRLLNQGISIIYGKSTHHSSAVYALFTPSFFQIAEPDANRRNAVRTPSVEQTEKKNHNLSRDILPPPKLQANESTNAEF